MDGLEISEIKFSEMFFENRLDSEYFLKDILIKDEILDKLASITIGSFSYVTDGIHESIEFDDKSNVNLISAKAPKKNYFDLSGTGFISKSQNEQNPRTQLKYNDIIVSTVGTIGNCAVVNEEVLPANSDRHVGIVRLNNDSVVKPRYLSTFILSKYGQYQTKRFTTGNVQPNLFIYKIKDIKVPVISNLWQDKIEGLVLQAEELLKDSKKCYKLAEKLLMDELNIKIYSTDLVSIKTLAESFKHSGRLDAEYYQPKYEQIETAIKNIKHTYLDVICDVETGEFISETLYGQEGFSYIRGTDITSHCIDVENATKVNTTINGLNVIENGDAAFAMIGSVGNVSINRGTTAIVSNNLGTIKPHDKKLSNYLLVYLLSDIGQALFEKYQTRTAQPKIKKEDVGKFLVPLLSDEEIEFISNKAEESFRLKEKSKELLDIAVKAVEMAIETDEESALLWLEIQKL